MSPKGYVPDRGDIVWLEFNPQAGHEQAGRRPALVVSPKSYNGKVGLALMCPITSKRKGYPFEVSLPSTAGISGVVLADQIKNLDWQARKAEFVSVAITVAARYFSRDFLFKFFKEETKMLQEASIVQDWINEGLERGLAAESLIACRGFDGRHMAETFVRNLELEPWRGYGSGPPRGFQVHVLGAGKDKTGEAGLVALGAR